MDTETVQRRRRTNATPHNAVVTEKRLKRSEVLAKKKADKQLIREAYAKKDQLVSFPAYRHFQMNEGKRIAGQNCSGPGTTALRYLAIYPIAAGLRYLAICRLSVCLKSGHGNKLPSPVKRYIQNLLKLNMEGPYGSEWQVEEKVKRVEMVDPEACYIFVHEVDNSNADEITTVLTAEDASTNRLEDSSLLVGFVHYRFVLEEEVPVLYVYELQVEPRVQGKGLGKFLMELIELIAQKNCMGAVMLTVQKANLSAMKFYTSKLRYIISATSPSKVNPKMETTYEILCKTFNDEAKTILEDSG